MNEILKNKILPVLIGAFIAWLFLSASTRETQRQMEWLEYQQLQKETQFHLQYMKNDINNSIEDIHKQLDGLYHEMDMLRRDSFENHTEVGNTGG